MTLPKLSDSQRRALLWLAEQISMGKPPTERVYRGLHDRGFTELRQRGERRVWTLTVDGRAVADELIANQPRTVASSPAPWFKNEPRCACKGADARLFFPGKSGWGATVQAKAICARCPIFDACAEYAVPITDLWGIWAGTNRADRAAIRRGEKPMPKREDLAVAA